MMLGWKKGLDFIKSRCDEREAPVLPDVVLEWLDLNRLERNYDDAYITDLKARVMATGFRMDDWRFHTDQYGWKLLLQPYTRDGARHYLLCVERASKPTNRDEQLLDKMLAYLGADPETNYLMSTRLATDPDVQDFWTWRKGGLPS